MNVKGFFALLASTIWRLIFTQLLATFRYRVAGGADNALLPESNGRAVFKKVYGNTVKWNQLMDSTQIRLNDPLYGGNDKYTKTIDTANCKSTFTFNGLTEPYTVSRSFFYLPNRVYSTTDRYYVSLVVSDCENITANTTNYLYVCGYASIMTLTPYFKLENKKYSKIGNFLSQPGTSNCIYQSVGTASNVILNPNAKFSLQLCVINLTQNFGSDAEIAAALGISVADITTDVGVAAFESWLALNVGTQDYYPYDGGSLISFKGQGVKSVGWNKFHVVNGSGVADVKKDVKYYVAGPFGSLHYSDGTAISVASDRTFTAIKDDTITFGSVSNSIVLNIYTGTAKDGTYEPYKESITYFNTDSGNIATLTGKKIVGGVPTGESVQIWPEGMKSVGNVYDELTGLENGYFTKVVKRIGVSVMGTGGEVTFIYSTITGLFKSTSLGSKIKYTASGRKSPMIASNYTTANANNSDGAIGNYDDKSLALYVANPPVTVCIKDTSYTDATTFNNVVQGQKLYYELATPEEYLLDTPIFARYAVDKYSTEELLVPASVAGEPTSTALVADIDYQAK